MRNIVAAVAAAVCAAMAFPALAQGTAPAASANNAQQERMKDCNAKAAGKSGDARKEFMNACLAGKEPQQLTAQQQRMKDCNAKATGKTGDARNEFMSACLSGKEPQQLTAQQQRMKDCNARAAGRTGDDRNKFMSECLKG